MMKDDRDNLGSDPPARELCDGSANLLFDHARRGARWAISCIVRETFCIAYTTASSLSSCHARLGEGFEFVQIKVMPQWHTVLSVRLLSFMVRVGEPGCHAHLGR
jgi:transposase